MSICRAGQRCAAPKAASGALGYRETVTIADLGGGQAFNCLYVSVASPSARSSPSTQVQPQLPLPDQTVTASATDAGNNREVRTSLRSRARTGRTRPPAHPRRDFEALQRQRLRGRGHVPAGQAPRRSAHALGVPRRARRAGTRCRREGGRKALAGDGRTGRLPRLSDEQLAHVVEALKAGPRANGFSTDLWTLKRVAEVIESAAGVRYGTSLTWEVLRWRLGWSRQWPPGAPSSATTRPKQTGPPSTGHA